MPGNQSKADRYFCQVPCKTSSMLVVMCILGCAYLEVLAACPTQAAVRQDLVK